VLVHGIGQALAHAVTNGLPLELELPT
jgi:hypothetical protein